MILNFESPLESHEEYMKGIYKGLRDNPDDIRFSMIEQGHDMMKEYRLDITFYLYSDVRVNFIKGHFKSK